MQFWQKNTNMPKMAAKLKKKQWLQTLGWRTFSIYNRHKEIRNSCNLKSCLSLQDAKDLQPLQLICYQLTLVLFKCISFLAQDTPFDNIWRYWFSFKDCEICPCTRVKRSDHFSKALVELVNWCGNQKNWLPSSKGA